MAASYVVFVLGSAVGIEVEMAVEMAVVLMVKLVVENPMKPTAEMTEECGWAVEVKSVKG